MKKLVTLILVSYGIQAWAATYWASPSGTDSDPGTEAKPFSITKAFATATAGDLVWVKGGTYKTQATLKFSNAGSASNYIKIWAVTGEKPIIDCADFANGTSTSRGIDMKKDYCHIKGLTIQYSGYNGVAVGASNCIIEGCTIHHCQIDGLTLTNNAKNTLVLNCDSYLNWDKSDGNNGDGFSAKRGSLEGNVFRGCRAWLNSDDGWDTYGGVFPVLLDSCWAFHNGINVFGYTGAWKGNGNGFKLGADGPDNAENVVTNSVAFGNKSKGFDHNHSNMGQTVINCTGFYNKAPNFSFYDNPSAGTLMKNIMRNNISYKGAINLAPTTENVTNSWDLGLNLTDNDFVSLDTNLALIERDGKYRIPETGLFRLKNASSAVDVGTVQNNVPLKGAIPYQGKAPDLGAFEYKGLVNNLTYHVESQSMWEVRPNPFQSLVEIKVLPSVSGPASVRIHDSNGQLVESLFEGELSAGDARTFLWESTSCPAGMYVSIVQINGMAMSKRMIKY